MPETAQPVVVIAGAGVSGLATGLAIQDLARQRGICPPALHLFEPQRQVGGKIRTIRADGFTCEWGVNGFLNKEPRTIELCRRLSLDDRLLPASGAFNKRYIYTRGKLRAVKMHPLKFLFSGILPLGAKLRLIRELWVPSRPPSGDSDESVADFARRRVGPVAFQTLVDPMQTGIYAGDPEQMSVVSSFPRVVEVEREYGSLIRGMARLGRERRRQGAPNSAASSRSAPKGREDPNSDLPGAGPSGHLTSFIGGMQTLVDRLAQELGPAVHCGTRVTRIERRDGGGYRVALERDSGDIESMEADGVILACPAHEAAAIAAQLDADLAAPLSEIAYSPLAVVCLGFPREQVAHPLDGFGFLVPRPEGLRILGALWTSTLFPERAPQGQVLVRVMIGGARDPDVLQLDDGELGALVQEEIRRVHGAMGPPSFVRLFRHPAAIPQYQLGHHQRLDRIERRLGGLPGLFITGNAYRGIGVNDCARNAHVLAAEVADWLSGRSPRPAT